jgi:hypothetical protein
MGMRPFKMMPAKLLLCIFDFLLQAENKNNKVEQRTARHPLLDSPVKCVERKNAQLGINIAIRAGLDEELNKLRDVQTQQRNFLWGDVKQVSILTCVHHARE